MLFSISIVRFFRTFHFYIFPYLNIIKYIPSIIIFRNVPRIYFFFLKFNYLLCDIYHYNSQFQSFTICNGFIFQYFFRKKEYLIIVLFLYLLSAYYIILLLLYQHFHLGHGLFDHLPYIWRRDEFYHYILIILNHLV